LCYNLTKYSSVNKITSVRGYRAAKTVALALQGVRNISNIQSILYELQTVRALTAAGLVQFDPNGGLIKDSIFIIQFGANNEKNFLTPIELANATLVYPIPQWFERVFDEKYKVSEIIIFAITTFLIVSIILLAIITIIFWLKGSFIITAASPEFLMLMLGGSILCLITIFL
jgi:hypothetical protein